MNHYAQRASGAARFLALLALAAALYALVPCARADTAILVGVDHYSFLPSDSGLKGPDNDVRLMAQRLRSLSFPADRIQVLTEGDATRQGILDALARARLEAKQSERFVFYFAGHGSCTPDGMGVIMPADARSGDMGSVIDRDTLYAAVMRIPAHSRTVILDSCFSGAMPYAEALEKSIHIHRVNRFYDLFGDAKRIVEVNKRTQPMGGGPGICYFVACDPHQRAYEDDFDGTRHGLFTYRLANRLRSLDEDWQAVQRDVSREVMQDSDQSQTPEITAAFAEATVFGQPPAKMALARPNAAASTAALNDGPSAPMSIWDAFNRTRNDSSQVRLGMTPDRTSVGIGEQFNLQASVRSAGYLLILELDPRGNIDLLYPASLRAEDAWVEAGTALDLPSDTTLAYSVDRPGVENLRAILFLSRQDAQDMLSVFAPNLQIDAPNRNKLTIPDSTALPFYTGSLSFEASDDTDL